MNNNVILDKILYLESYRETLNQIIATTYLRIEDEVYFLERSIELEESGEMNNRLYLGLVCNLAIQGLGRTEINNKLKNNTTLN